MGSYKIRRLHLPENIAGILEKNNLNTCKDVLSLSKLELQSLLGINRNKIENLLQEISKKCITDPQTVYNIIKNQELASTNVYLPLSLPSLDLLLQGGLPFGSLTEFTGPPGVGKTQFCFMLSLLAALPSPLGLEGNVIYIDTESAFCAQRIRSIALKRFPQIIRKDNDVIPFLQRILVHKVNSVIGLKEVVLQLEKEIIRKQVKIVIVDSIASLIRKEFGTDDISSIMERNKILVEQAAILKDLAQTYNIVVFLTNQIVSHLIEINSILPDDSVDDEDNIDCNLQVLGSTVPPAPVQKKPKFQGVDADHVIPALGNTWSHCVNTRLVAQFLDSTVRQLTIVKSPLAPNAAVRYIINESGIVLTDDDIEFVNVLKNDHQNILTKNNFLTTEMTGTGVVFTAPSTKNNL
ncbi:DNA repair protein RAD51 homolog 2-like [Argiope bruennichi]|uniref:DNA repair protein RAD51 homolog 2-like n=1 Tax=Argiope bruennichi TaxID=94029 RepID=UPI002494B0FB|nr:DNA repair protein RAD51 homolog 2-like [Argiope bruennichi]